LDRKQTGEREPAIADAEWNTDDLKRVGTVVSAQPKMPKKKLQNRTCTDKEIRLGGLTGFGRVKTFSSASPICATRGRGCPARTHWNYQVLGHVACVLAYLFVRFKSAAFWMSESMAFLQFRTNLSSLPTCSG